MTMTSDFIHGWSCLVVAKMKKIFKFVIPRRSQPKLDDELVKKHCAPDSSPFLTAI